MHSPLYLHDLLSTKSVNPTKTLGVYEGQMNSKNILVFQFLTFDAELQEKIIATLENEYPIDPDAFQKKLSDVLLCDQNNKLKCRRLRKLERMSLNIMRTRESGVEDVSDIIVDDNKHQRFVLVVPSNLSSNQKDKSIDPRIKRLQGKKLPVQTAQYGLDQVRTNLINRYPDYGYVIDQILAKPFRLEPVGKFHIEPTLLVGPPGSGKSSFLKQLVAEMGFKQTTLNLAGMQDDHFLAGVSSGYSSAQPSTLLRTISKEYIANPIVIFDELDKVSKTNNSDIQSRLLGLLEEHESAHWYEAYLQSEVDFSHLSFLFTANTLESIPSALKSRLRIVEMPSLTDVHIKTYINNIVSEVSSSSEIDPRFYQFTDSDYRLLSDHWKDHRNLRLLKKQVTFLLDQSVSVEHSAFLQ